MGIGSLIERWWVFIVRGVLTILYGVLTLVLPPVALTTLVLWFGIYCLVQGVLLLAAAYRGRRAPLWVIHPVWFAAGGVVSFLCGLFALVLPRLTEIALVYVIAGYTVASGVMDIVLAIRLRKVIHGEWMLLVAGAVSIAFGVLVAIFPDADALKVALWIGAWAIAFGALLCAVGGKLKKLGPGADELLAPAVILLVVCSDSYSGLAT